MAHRLSIPIRLAHRQPSVRAKTEILDQRWFQRRAMSLAGFSLAWILILTSGLAATGRVAGVW